MRMAALLLGVTACGRLGFDSVESAAPDAATTLAVGDGAAVRYRATAVRFAPSDGDYIWTGALANTTNSPRGTYSAWIHFNAGDDQQQLISVAQVIGVGGVVRTASNRIQFLLPNCAGLTLLDLQSQDTYTSSSGWMHILASWDLTAGRADLYIDDVAERATNVTMLAGDVCYSSLKWGIGGLLSGQLDADVADLYASLGTYIDLDIEANRRLFSDGAGKPIDLGADCSRPIGSVPTGCFVGPAGSWPVNKGVAAGMTVQGDGLTVAPTSPSD